MQITYCGPLPAVTIARTGQHAPRGVPVEVDDELAAELLAQDTWRAHQARRRATPTTAGLTGAKEDDDVPA